MKQHDLLQSKHFYLLGCLLLLSTFCGYAQEYQWQWAKSGGGEEGGTSNTFYKFSDEYVIDIAIDNDNNYYYLMQLRAGSPMYHDDSLPEDLTLEHYGHKDILLISTDEDGAYRWYQVIGGDWTDIAHSIVVDSDNGVYLNATLASNAIEGDNKNYRHLSTDVTLPKIPENWDYTMPHEAFKIGYLLKYAQSDGSLLTYKAYQEEVLISSFGTSRLWIDSNDIIHTYVSLKNGTHLDGLVTVEGIDVNEVSVYQSFLVEFDTSLNIIDTPREFLISGANGGNYFSYDEDLDRYYIIGMKGSGPIEYSYNNVEIEGATFILAIDAETLEEEWRSGFNDAGNVSPSATTSDTPSIFV